MVIRRSFRAIFLAGICTAGLFAAPSAARAQAARDRELEGWIAHLERIVPSDAREFTDELPGQVAESAKAVDAWAADAAMFRSARTATALIDQAERLLEAKSRVDSLLDATLERRAELADAGNLNGGRDRLRSYLRVSSRLIDLSGRLRYLHNDALATVVKRVGNDRGQFDRLVELLTEHRSSVGAVLAAARLADGSTRDPRGAAADLAHRMRLLKLISASGNTFVLPQLAEVVADRGTPPEVVIVTAETIRDLGLPQDAHADAPDDLPKPAIKAAELAAHLARIDVSRLSGMWAARHADLLNWLEVRRQQGVTEDALRLGSFEIRPGDWMLMRNPSPYNLFTDLSPGLFTHVGVVTSEVGHDGISRIVIVDLPERGDHIPSTNADIYVERSLHYMFLRHPDAQVAESMARAARQIIGNPSQFDLNFRTDRVADLAGKPLDDVKIHTYCAGLLLLCAQQTTAPRDAFFPIQETTAGTQTQQNLAKLGLSLGEGFVSPTGALFSPQLMIVGRREPMYDPRREVEEAVFDHFATCLESKELTPSHDLFQYLRLRMAEASQTNLLLAEALAQAAGVNANMDLVSAAKAAAVVETLDEIAFGHSEAMLEARELLTAGPIYELRSQGFTDDDIELVRSCRQSHADLYRRLESGQLTPRQLRMALVEYYIDAGRRAIEQRFFQSEEAGR